VQLDGSEEYVGFENVIRYEDGVKSDFVLASCSVPINYDYTRLDVEKHALIMEGQRGDKDPSTSKDRTTVRPPKIHLPCPSLSEFQMQMMTLLRRKMKCYWTQFFVPF
jgi:hypothetical protein